MSTCSGFIEPLNLQCILINMFAGTEIIFLFIAFLAIAGLAASFKMRNGTGVLMLAVFGLIFSQLVGGVYVLIILIGGLISFVSIKRIVSRQ